MDLSNFIKAIKSMPTEVLVECNVAIDAELQRRYDGGAIEPLPERPRRLPHPERD